MTYAKKIRGEKLKERRVRESKKAKFEHELSNVG